MKGTTETLSFQAETRQLLDIVANSLYTDKVCMCPRLFVASRNAAFAGSVPS